MSKQVRLIIITIFIAFFSYIALVYYESISIFKFSVGSGFYDEDFYVEIQGPSSEIYYTLDGSIPSRDSHKYEGEIKIVDASNNENVYALIEEVSSYFYKDYISMYTTQDLNEELKINDQLVDKATIIRAIYYDDKGQPSDIISESYYVGYEQKEGYSGLGTISVISDPDDLFGYDNGIYVGGVTLDNYIENSVSKGEELTVFRWWPANYRKKGREWEREASIHIFDSEGLMVLNKDVGIRIQGGVSRGIHPKSLNVFARLEYDYSNEVEYRIWGDSSEYIADAFTIASGGNDYYSKTKDRLVAQLCNNLAVTTLEHVPYNMFLNGEYWGVYHLAEKYTEQYFNYYYNAPLGQITMIKAGGLEIGSQADEDEFKEFYKFLIEADFSEADNYDYLWKQMDKESTIDYFAVMLYFARTGDWTPIADNSAIWKNRYYIDDELNAKWKWCVYDMNSTGINGIRNNVDSIQETMERVPWFASLCENEDFKFLLSNRLYELMKTEFEENRIKELFASNVTEIEQAMHIHYDRFYNIGIEYFYEQINDINTFFEGRNDNMRRFIVENLGIEEQIR